MSRNLPAWMTKKSYSNDVANSNEENSDIPMLKFPGVIKYCYFKEECNMICSEILEASLEEDIVFGFDMEWKVTYVTGDYRQTAVLQLCSNDEKCYIFQVSMMNGFPCELKKVIESEDIIKTGLNINGDMSHLNVDYNITANGVVELSELANQSINNHEKWSLNGLLMNKLGYQLVKDSNVRCGDWEMYPLTKQQLEYAALDAYAGLIIYKKLNTT